MLRETFSFARSEYSSAYLNISKVLLYSMKIAIRETGSDRDKF